jgi:ATP-dependent RNA helicase DeaD
MTSFNDLGVPDKLIDKLETRSITEPTDIQEKAIPPIMDGEDMLAEAETGSGKTLAFGLPLMMNITDRNEIQAIVLAPTRELAKQVAAVLKDCTGEDHVATIYGGVSYDPQIQAAKKANICVGTPGRVLDLCKQGHLDLSNVAYFVLDEADRLLDMGFVDDIEAIMSFCPDKRQTLFFSATIPRKLQKFYKKYTDDAEVIRIEKTHHTRNLEQYFIDVKPNEKLSTLYTLIKERENELCLVFCRTKDTTRFVAKTLRNNGVKAKALNGDLSQPKREEVVEQFKNREFKVIVATDVAARGIHIENITHVFNYDVPDTPETYTHRIGRTARQGAKGEAITLLEKDDHRTFRKIHRDNREIDRMQDTPDLQPVDIP